MGFFDFLKSSKTEQVSVDFSNLGVDLHSHLIPGIDDGSKSLEESVNLVKALIDLGFQKLITTPHIMGDYYKNTPDIILSGRDKVREALLKNKIDIPFDAAAEYYCDENFIEILKTQKLLTIADQYLLFELSYLTKPNGLREIIFEMQMRGYKPLLAHPERYPYLRLNDYQEYKQAGCLFQLNILSLTGHYGSHAKETVEELLENNLIDFVATDLHHMQHINLIYKYAAHEEKLFELISYHQLLNKTLY
jgi:tyrosine-protein phosphatase YwqE